MKAISGLFICLTLSVSAFAKNNPNYEDCRFSCKGIPSEEDSLLSFGAAKMPTLPEGKIKILAWNLYKGEKKYFSEQFPIVSKGRDIILLSEVVTGAPVEPAMTKIADFGWNFGASFEMKNQVLTGTAVGSNVVALNPHIYRTKLVEPIIKTPKTITAAEFALPGTRDTLLVLSIHGINMAGDDALISQLEPLVPELKSHLGPIVFAGDFNTKNPTRLKMATDLLATAGLRRVTWENAKPGKQLDDAFTRGLKVRAKFIFDYVGTASDHPAIALEVTP